MRHRTHSTVPTKKSYLAELTVAEPILSEIEYRYLLPENLMGNAIQRVYNNRHIINLTNYLFSSFSCW
jgi:hypothetical protein